MALTMSQRPKKKKRRPKKEKKIPTREKMLLKVVNGVFSVMPGGLYEKGDGVGWKSKVMMERLCGSKGLPVMERANHVQNTEKISRNSPPMMLEMVCGP
jgi:hypothetical protein